MDADQYHRACQFLLEHHSALMLHALQYHKGQTPKKRQTRTELSAILQQDSPEGEEASQSLACTVLPHAYTPCAVRLAELTPANIDELRLETVHRGIYLVVRNFGKPHCFQSVQNVVEDAQGQVDRLSVYNFEPDDQVLPEGSIFAIKEPYYMLSTDGFPLIRIDHPSDLVRLDITDIHVSIEFRMEDLTASRKSMVEHKNEGNTASRCKDYRQAVASYSRALQADTACETRPELLLRHDILRNRALANIHLGRFEESLADADASVLPSDRVVDRVAREKLNSKSIYRAGCAAYHLQNFTRAEESFTEVLELIPQNADAQRELKDTRSRLIEQNTGVYDFLSMTRDVLRGQQLLDNASYIAKVQIRDTPDRGRGLFAKHDLRVGDLVLCEKALFAAFQTGTAKDYDAIINLNTGSYAAGTGLARLHGVVHKLLHNPAKAQAFASLYDGGHSPKVDTLPDGFIDTFQVEAALEYNGFGCPLIPTSVGPEAHTIFSSTGVWLTTSAINHKCIGNVNNAFIGDMIVIRAMRDIAVGKEITMRYCDKADFDRMQKDIERAWGFTCKCKLCAAEREAGTEVHRRRAKAVNEANFFLGMHRHDDGVIPLASSVRKAERLREQIASTYRNTHGLPRKSLSDINSWLCTAYALAGISAEAFYLRTLLDLGIRVSTTAGEVKVDYLNCVPHDSGVHAAMYLSAFHEQQGSFSVARSFKDFGRQLYGIFYGSEYGFEEKYGSD